jgi:hypothetical protein
MSLASISKTDQFADEKLLTRPEFRDERTYEGIHAVPSMVMAAMETCGIRQRIDDRCRALGLCGCNLSAGMAVKAMVGAMVERGSFVAMVIRLRRSRLPNPAWHVGGSFHVTTTSE